MREGTLTTLVAILAPLSVAAIGGASGIYAPLQHQTVDVLQWLTPQEFVELFAIARVTPGPGSMLATLIGFKVAGLAGAAVATLALFLPSSLTALRSPGCGTAIAAGRGTRPSRTGLRRSV